MTDVKADSLRIDKWLWQARFFKTRTLAGKFAGGGKIRLRRNAASERVTKPSAVVRSGDVLTFQLGLRIRIIEIVELGVRRGPATEAQTLYIDLSPPAIKKETIDTRSSSSREKGSGRPTKKDRRAFDRFNKTAASD